MQKINFLRNTSCSLALLRSTLQKLTHFMSGKELSQTEAFLNFSPSLVFNSIAQLFPYTNYALDTLLGNKNESNEA